MPTSLVTGASGFIGPRLVARLQESGHEVACLVRPTSKTDRLEPLGVRLIHGDVTDADSLPAALAGVDEVYHLAGKLHAARLADYLPVNEQGAANLARACAAAANPPKLIAVSSLAAAGPSPPGQPHTEATPAAPISNYGRSKLAGERALRPTAGGVPTTIVRPPIVFGPGDRDGFVMFQALRRTRIHPVPNRSGLPVSLVYADDLCDALVAAAERGERLPPNASEEDPTGLYYAADPNPSTWADVGRMAARALGVRVLVLRLRKWPFLIPALAGDALGHLTGKPTLFGMDKLREASATGWVCTADKARDQLGFAPGASLEDRYRHTADWYRETGWL